MKTYAVDKSIGRVEIADAETVIDNDIGYYSSL